MTETNTAHPGETHAKGFGGSLNRLRAGVLGAQDGIVSTAGLVIGVAGASDNSTALLIAGLAGLVSGALSMAGGEYVSVSAQRDAEIAVVEKERLELQTMPERELAELAENVSSSENEKKILRTLRAQRPTYFVI